MNSPADAPAPLLDEWCQRAAARPQRIILADAGDGRALTAADELNSAGIVEAVVVGREVGHLSDVGHGPAEDLVAGLAAVTSGPWAGRPLDIEDPLIIATALVKTGWAAGCVAGAGRPTSDVVRAGLRVLEPAPGVETVSSCFFFLLPDGTNFVYGDCGVVADPDAKQLASVAIASAATFAELTGAEPHVAMLSFSTKGSSVHARIDKVKAATELVKLAAPDLNVDGELQFDAAWEPTVALHKAPESAVAGRANVFVFPDLDSGNIAYKITERVARAKAFGPLLQGLDGVLHDLSRGCCVDDIFNVAVIAALQAASADQGRASGDG